MKDNYKDLFNINPKYSTTAAFLIGLILIENMNSVEQNALGEWLILIGQTLITNSGFQIVIENRIKGNNININDKKVKSIYNPFLYNIKEIKNILNKIYPNYNNDINNLSKIINELKDKLNKKE